MDDPTLNSLDLVVDSLRFQLHQYSEIVQELLGKLQVAHDQINELQTANNYLLEQLSGRNGNCSNCELQRIQTTGCSGEEWQFSQNSNNFSENPWDTVYVDCDRLLAYCQNINRMESDKKIDRIKENLIGRPYAVVMFTETSWNNRIASAKLFRNRYNVYRCDRDLSMKQNGGGVLIAVNAKFKSEQLAADRTDIGFEQVWAKVQLDNGQVHVFAVVYFSVGSKKDQYERFFRCAQRVMSSQSADVKFHIYGDFNQKKAMFKPHASNEHILIPEWSVTDSTVGLICEWMRRLQLNQVNRVVNQRGRFLDLLLTNCTEKMFVRQAPNPLHENEVDHTAIEYLVDV